MAVRVKVSLRGGLSWNQGTSSGMNGNKVADSVIFIELNILFYEVKLWLMTCLKY